MVGINTPRAPMIEQVINKDNHILTEGVLLVYKESKFQCTMICTSAFLYNYLTASWDVIPYSVWLRKNYCIRVHYIYQRYNTHVPTHLK